MGTGGYIIMITADETEIKDARSGVSCERIRALYTSGYNDAVTIFKPKYFS
jgi:hypothetical protein